MVTVSAGPLFLTLPPPPSEADRPDGGQRRSRRLFREVESAVKGRKKPSIWTGIHSACASAVSGGQSQSTIQEEKGAARSSSRSGVPSAFHRLFLVCPPKEDEAPAELPKNVLADIPRPACRGSSCSHLRAADERGGRKEKEARHLDVFISWRCLHLDDVASSKWSLGAATNANLMLHVSRGES